MTRIREEDLDCAIRAVFSDQTEYRTYGVQKHMVLSTFGWLAGWLAGWLID